VPVAALRIGGEFRPKFERRRRAAVPELEGPVAVPEAEGTVTGVDGAVTVADGTPEVASPEAGAVPEDIGAEPVPVATILLEKPEGNG